MALLDLFDAILLQGEHAFPKTAEAL